MRRVPAPPAGPRARHLHAIDGGRKDEAETRRRLYPYEARRVRQEPRPEPTPPRAA